MKIVRGFALGFAATAMVILSGAYAVASNPATVGDFLSAYAKALKIELPANTSGEALVSTLRAAGVKLDAKVDVAKPLTQGDVVKMGKANGLRLTTNRPEAAFTTQEIGQFFTSFTSFGLFGSASAAGTDTRYAAADNPPGDPAGHANTSKGKKKGRPFTCPTEPQ
jgi:hypothetical protein